MRLFNFTAILLIVTVFAGCQATKSPLAVSEGGLFKGEVAQVGKMAPFATSVELNLSKDSLNIYFPKLDNRTGEGFAKTKCESDFTFSGSSTNSYLKSKTFIYEGEFIANNNCALFVEQPSTTYDLPRLTQYAILEVGEKETTLTISFDKAGEERIIRGVVE
ncbi:MAG: hypothetical protein M0P02_02100 [Sulfurospirillaceae bacterium]|nr:hypothetical protein [Sulfurospirillaceae bacterium]MCK9546024.1 hypothetical protein [Sulfurospirillaceae bacterium]MDY0237664.1 hypothetical protein [Campylobacterales bacterium]NLM98848.1 hypothetical protein [Campylobacteraceae bacterium]